MSTVCSHCGGTDIEYDQARGDAVCTGCGSVLEDNIIVSEVTFAENGGGGSSVMGQFVSSENMKHHHSGPGYPHGMGRDSREITLQHAKKRITHLAHLLKLNQHCIDSAFMFFKMALQMNLTRGRKSCVIDTACLYLVCRSEGTPHLLLDFSDVLQINVYALGRAFLKLSNALHINPPAIDPCLYIHRFAHKLELGEKTHEVSMTALRLVARMKRDWIHHGRRPSGLCGAALLVSARLHNFSRSVREVARVVKLSEGTIRKRLGDFKDTPSSRLTIDEFLRVDLEQEHDPPSYTEAKKKAKADVKTKDEKDHPLEKSSSIAVNNGDGLEGGEDSDDEVSGGFSGIKMDSVQDIITKARFAESFLKGTPTFGFGDNLEELAELVDEVPTLKQEDASTDTEDLKEEDTLEEKEDQFQDLDDDELDKMILSSEEVDIKSQLWFAENGDFLKEQEIRKQRLAQEKIEKEKNRKRHFRPRKVKVQQQQGLASNAGEAIERMLVEKRISSKINYDVLKDLADGFGVVPSELSSKPPLDEQEVGVANEVLDNDGLIVPRGSSVASGRLPSLSVRRRKFSSLEGTSGLDLPSKFSRTQSLAQANSTESLMVKSSNYQSSSNSGDTHGEDKEDFLSSVIASRLETARHLVLDKGLSGDSVCGVGVVEETGPVEYEEGGLDDEEMEELAYDEDPLLHSDCEDEGDYEDI